MASGSLSQKSDVINSGPLRSLCQTNQKKVKNKLQKKKREAALKSCDVFIVRRIRTDINCFNLPTQSR